MEEKEVIRVFYDMFEKALPILRNIKEGFRKESSTVLKEQARAFGDTIKSSLPFFEEIVKKKEKNEVEKKAIDLLITAQLIASGIENLTKKMISKVEGDVIFSERAKGEIEELVGEVEEALRDLKDFLITRNPDLKRILSEKTQKIIEMAHEFDTTHQRRLITGICMPKASYLFLEMTDSIRKVSREMRNFVEKM
ncbi:MAG: hypothetical protein NZ583_00410 [Desulfobacterota bacterium]|nr:hypothetical protein [Thermodesulfobacteriota bacterium]MDW8001175.1 hypothetical protein [Deltaproteobacteria bacterium]